MMATVVHKIALRREKGFSMLEVLIALAVFSISLLGLALMQQTSMQGLTGSSQLTDAVFLAEDIADRIRANRSHALSSTTYDSLGNAADADCVSGCTEAQVAAKDLSDWQGALTAAGATGVIVRSGDSFLITVNWNEKNQDDNNAGTVTVAKTYAIRVQP